MGKAGRFACIFVPMALSIASLLCLIIIFLGGTNSKSAELRDLYFMKIDAKDFTTSPNFDLIAGDADKQILDALELSLSANTIKDLYTIHLWNHCSSSTSADISTIDFCSPRKTGYFFNATSEFGLEGSLAQDKFPQKLQDGMEVYEKVAGWMFAAYVIAIIATAVEIVVGIFAIFSRWGSFVTTIVTTISTIFTLAAAATSTAVFSILTGALNAFFRPYHIKTSLSTKMLSVVWLAVAFSVAAGLFWSISVCCCSGKSDHKRKTFAEKTPYTYERVASPYMGNSGAGAAPVQHPVGGAQGASAYEPFRGSRV